MKLPLPPFNRRIIKIIPVLHGARWLLNKDIVRGANSYPLKGIIGARTERAPSPFLSSRQGDERTRTKETTLTRGGGRDRRLSAPGLQRARRLRSKRFSSCGDNGGRKERERAAVEGDGKVEEWLLLALRRILIELLAAFLSLLSHARAALSVFGFV